jgi:hypothetical protein
MATWQQFSDEAPQLAGAVQAALDAGKHKVMATLRSDGSPRVSGTEVPISGGEVWLGSMPSSVKARDLQRDPRVAIHSATIDEELKTGDAKVSGRAVEVTDPEVLTRFSADFAEESGQDIPEPFHLFRVDITEVVLTTVEGDHLVVRSWHEGRGERRVERS